MSTWVAISVDPLTPRGKEEIYDVYNVLGVSRCFPIILRINASKHAAGFANDLNRMSTNVLFKKRASVMTF